MHYLQITFADEKFNGFAVCGGVGIESKDEWERQWHDIPASPLGDKDPCSLLLDKMSPDLEFIEEKFITKETAERLLGKPYEQIIADGRRDTPYTVGEMLIAEKQAINK